MRIAEQLQEKLTPQLWGLLLRAAAIAQTSGWDLYLVGGVVRDLLLAERKGERLGITDIDLVVDGCQQVADVGAGVQLANALQAIYPAAHLDIHGTFQTAALVWDRNSDFGALGVDIATARTESYAYPAANPDVSPSSIRQDLYRRDFTINALAWRLTPSPESPLLDLFGGVDDLAARQIRVLHAHSFIDDPTRIYRGVRFAVRLGFQLETQTAAYIREAIHSGVYIQTMQAHRRTPALQVRLRNELLATSVRVIIGLRCVAVYSSDAKIRSRVIIPASIINSMFDAIRPTADDSTLAITVRIDYRPSCTCRSSIGCSESAIIGK
jgi:tRNA nucleotidyltransferase (CCA-adding enzyme)